MYIVIDDADPNFMEKFRLTCLNDPTMQALYTNEIEWADVPDNEPPFETDHWREYLLQSKLAEWQEPTAGRRVRSVPSSPVHRSAVVPSYSVPSSPVHRSFGSAHSAFGPAPLSIASCNDPVQQVTPPSTPVFSAIPKRHPRLLEAIREVDSASHTPDRTRTPSPMPKLPAATAPPPVQGAWKARQELNTILRAAPILSSAAKSTLNKAAEPSLSKTLEPTLNKAAEPSLSKAAKPTLNKTFDPDSEKRTVFLKDLPLNTSIQDIHTAVRRPHGKLASVTCILHARDPTMNVHLRFERWPAAKSAVKFGVALHEKTYPAEYSTIQT